MSLVPDYAYSDSEDNSDTNLAQIDIKNEQTSRTSTSSDSELENDIKDNKITSAFVKSLPPAEKLPVPGFLNKDAFNCNGKYAPTTSTSTSVFSNPFVEAENAKKSVLEKHVKMINGGAAMTINGKKVCWNYRKGRCRFGHNCKYAHDSDLQKTEAQLSDERHIQRTVICQSGDAGRPIQQIQGTDVTDSSAAAESNKRKRPGLTQGLQPGKKVLKQYHKLKCHHN